MADDSIGFSMKKEGATVAFDRRTAKGVRTLSYDVDKCVGCGLCFVSCPFEAIELGPMGAVTLGVSDSQKITIDPAKCVLCGICTGVCPFKVIMISDGGATPAGSAQFMTYDREFVFDQEKCAPLDDGSLCDLCEEACPRDAIECSISDGTNTIDFKEASCSYCTACVPACPRDAIQVEKGIEGEVIIDLDTCQSCGACVEICPNDAMEFPKAEFGQKVEKLICNQDTCVFCGACERVCPVDAIVVKRTKVNYKKEKNRSWTRRWEQAFNDLVTEEAEE